MKTNALLFLVFTLLAFSTSDALAQTNTAIADTIDSQFEHVIESSGTYQKYKVIKISKIKDLRKTTRNQIVILEQRIDSLHKKIEVQQSQANQLHQKLEKADTDITRLTKSKDEFSFLGTPIQKDTYSTMVWIIILILAIVLTVFVYKFKQSYRITSEARKNFNDKEQELNDYRKKALEEQQKLGRQLMDERRKQNSTNGNS